jgi:hypothetical protein
MAEGLDEPDEALSRLEAFLSAGIADLCRLVTLPDLTEFCPESQSPKRAPTVAAKSTPPSVADLTQYLLLLSHGLRPKHKMLYPLSDRLRTLLHRIFRKAHMGRNDGSLEDVQGLRPSVRTLARFARMRIPGFERTAVGLKEFGVTSVEKSLAILTEKLAMTFAREIAKDPTKVPAELLGASLVASATSPGVIEKVGHGHTVRGLMQLGARAGLTITDSNKPHPDAEKLVDVRGFLKRAGRALKN